MLTSSLQVSIFEKALHSERIAKIQHSIQNFLDVNLSSKVYIHHKHCEFAKKKHVLKNPELLTMFLNILDFLGSGFTQFFRWSQKQGEFHGLIQVTTDHDCFRTYFGMSVRQFELWLGTHLRRRRNHFREPADPEPCCGSDFHIIVNLVPVCVLSYERTFCQM